MYQKILVPIDSSSTAARGLDEAIRLAQLTHGRIRLMHVIDETAFGYMADAYSGYVSDWMGALQGEADEMLKAAAARVQAAGLVAETVVLDGLQGRLQEFVASQVELWQADLVVLGTHGRRGVGRAFLGSDAEQIVRLSSVPVLLVRAPEAAVPAPAATTAKAAPATIHVHQPSAALSFE